VATPGNASASVTWHAAASNGHTITGYTVTSAPDGKTCTTAGSLTCTVNSLTNGTSYTFTVTATSSAGTGPASPPSAAVVPATVPGAPTGVAGTPGDETALVSWMAPASSGGKAITGYTVTSVPGGKTCTTSGALSCSVFGLTNGTAYTFSATATNPVGTGPASTASLSVTPMTVAGATYVVISPTRLVDSRTSKGGLTKLSANHHQTVTFSGGPIPTDALALTGNLTVTNQTAAGYFSLTTDPNDAPLTSTLNFPVGDNRANGVTVPLNTSGPTPTLSFVYVAHGGATADVILDVTGYFVP
jgi:hypothetical protein